MRGEMGEIIDDTVRINIIGHGEGYEEGYAAPGEKWAINYWHPQIDMLFEIHPSDHPFGKKLLKERQNAAMAGTPLITQTSWDMRQAMLDLRTEYFGSSTDWVIAYALLNRKPDEIHLYGVTMDDKGDHYEKRCATDYWMGRAEGMGVRTFVHGNSTVKTTSDGLIYGLFEPFSYRHKFYT